MIALPLFDGLPSWWQPLDTRVCEAYASEDAREWPRFAFAPPDDPGYDPDAADAFCRTLHPRADDYTCRRCLWWSSLDGEHGDCEGPEGSCGRVPHWTMCEQWAPRVAAEGGQ